MEQAHVTVAMPEHIAKLMEANIRLEGDLWSIGEIATFLGLKNNTVSGSIVNAPAFPQPIILPSGGKRWYAKEVKAWALKRR